MYNTQASCQAQREYCEKKNAPHFASYDGRCWNCKQDIYKPMEHKQGDRIYTTGITVEKAGRELVTGCPHCNRSYCD